MFQGYSKDRREETCSYCGAIYIVDIPGLLGHEEREEYFCPECSHVNFARASNSPRVSLVKARTDGKNDKSPSFQALIDSYKDE
ncbi:hypothetical protein [Acinetobacter baumannii]|uniref:hypothetical protein n=1 Tax=Acinetobacter baumannii TaxID=470 RepID=UPI00321B8E56